MEVVLLGVAMFTTVIVTLVALLMWARSRLVPEGDVLLLINDEPGKALSVAAGQTLLSALAAKNVFVPSACGGKGTCGLCKVQVEGAGEPLPTERGFLTRGEVLRGSRLACQVKVKSDLKVEVAAEAFDIKHLTCKVVSNESVADFIKELVLELPAGEEVSFKAGQYMQFQCPPNRIAFKDFDIPERFRKSWDRWGLWDYVSVCDEQIERAYSMASYPDEKGVLKFDIKIALPPGGAPKGTPPGMMSSYLFALKPGDELTMSGPFGDFGATDTDAEMIFLGGGAGMAPLRSIVYDQIRRGDAGRKMSYWYRAHSLRDALYLGDFERLAAERDNFRWELCLSKPEPEDEWEGYVGYLHNFLYDTYLKDHPAPEDCEYYLCGPRALSVGILELLYDLGVEQESIFYDNFAGEDQVGSH
ncbi:MAG: NADH:ubiquinone reductase (Na(+)-transporting) subunit F [Chromatiales bacterium]|jgi:Na+-transporting NADH:ubiquinone oxidoreductase subunit F